MYEMNDRVVLEDNYPIEVTYTDGVDHFIDMNDDDIMDMIKQNFTVSKIDGGRWDSLFEDYLYYKCVLCEEDEYDRKLLDEWWNVLSTESKVAMIMDDAEYEKYVMSKE